ncbi:MAG: hypothetical protein P1P76_06160 [Anaerolineales bacterium]|nr:hypothetical protein [Anaerolineales bacterium]
MATYAVSPSYGSISPDDGFKLAQFVLPEAGFTIWKERPLGWLLIANQQTSEGVINATLSFQPTGETVMSLSLASGDHSEQALRQAADRFLALFEDKLPVQND